jgi:hypothetical protein
MRAEGARAANRIGPFAVLPFPQSDQIEAVESHRIDHVPFRYGDPTLLAGLRRTLGRGRPERSGIPRPPSSLTGVTNATCDAAQ